MIKSRALDDRAGCAILIDMIQHDLAYDMEFVFAVQEEIGLRGSKTAAYAVNPQAAIVVESTTAADVAGVAKDRQVCRIGEGAVISLWTGTQFMIRNIIEWRFLRRKQRV